MQVTLSTEKMNRSERVVDSFSAFFYIKNMGF